MNPKVDEVLNNAKYWQDEMKQVRSIMLETGLDEELKWYQACYTYNKAVIAIIGEYKDCCVLSFFKGSLLKDPYKVLSKPGENSQSARILRFTSVEQVNEHKEIIKEYIRESISNEEAGLKVQYKSEFTIPVELQKIFEQKPEFKDAFYALTPGRQRSWIYNFSQPKNASTRILRIEKAMDSIFDGKGLNDR